MSQKKIFSVLQIKHLVYFGLFLVALVFRFCAAGQLEITQPEADILLNLGKNGGASVNSGSMLYQLLTLPLISMFGSGHFVIRFWTVLAASLLVLLPLMFEDDLGSRTALILSLLLTLDPFQIVNSFQINGSSLSILVLCLTIGSVIKREDGLAIGAFIGFLLSGSNALYGIVFMAVICAVACIGKQQALLLEPLKNVIKSIKEKSRMIMIILAIIILLSFLFKVEISIIFRDLIEFFKGWLQPYVFTSLPQLFPLALIAYLPLGILGLVYAVGVKNNRNFGIYLVYWIIVSLIFITFYPAHQVLDLIWVSLPICVLGAIGLNALIDRFIKYPRRNFIYAVLLACVMVSLTINFGKLVYQLSNGYNALSAFLSIIFLMILLIMAVIFLAYNESIAMSFSVLKVGILAVVLVVQISFCWRSLGLNGNPAAEILWGGYFEGSELVRETIDNANFKVLDTDLEDRIAMIDYGNEAVKWALEQDYPTDDLSFGVENQSYAVIITESDEGLSENTAEGYYGQEFVSSSYPLWIWQPFKSFVDSDFWNWLIFRQGQMIREYDYLWMSKTLF